MLERENDGGLERRVAGRGGEEEEKEEESEETKRESGHGVSEVNIQAFSYDFCVTHWIGSLKASLFVEILLGLKLGFIKGV